jgi:hypothetical protein
MSAFPMLLLRPTRWARTTPENLGQEALDLGEGVRNGGRRLLRPTQATRTAGLSLPQSSRRSRSKILDVSVLPKG